MTGPVDDAGAGDSHGLREVRDAYGELPPLQPGAALDASVRAAVAAELAADGRAPVATPASGRLLPLRRWRRMALPLATAATLVIAVGLWQLRGTHDAARESTVAGKRLGVVRETPAGPTLLTPPPPASAKADAALAEVAPETSSQFAYAAKAAPGASGFVAAQDARARDVDTSAATRTTDEATFAEARRLLAAGRREAATELLARWRAAHAGIGLPADLQPLLAEAPHQPSLH